LLLLRLLLLLLLPLLLPPQALCAALRSEEARSSILQSELTQMQGRAEGAERSAASLEQELNKREVSAFVCRAVL
jgi:hypothetical protein